MRVIRRRGRCAGAGQKRLAREAGAGPKGPRMTVSHAAPPHPASDLDAALRTLRGRRLRFSSARRLVLEALYAAPGPVTAEQIASGLGGRLPSSDLASVYRNLETLEEVGLVRHVHLGHGPGRYAPTS